MEDEIRSLEAGEGLDTLCAIAMEDNIIKMQWDRLANPPTIIIYRHNRGWGDKRLISRFGEAGLAGLKWLATKARNGNSSCVLVLNGKGGVEAGVTLWLDSEHVYTEAKTRPTQQELISLNQLV